MHPARSTETIALNRTLNGHDRPHPASLAAKPIALGLRCALEPVHDARALTGGGPMAEIRLDGVRYVLRITRQGKLILTK